jgi:hypothetical protein
VAGPRFSPFTSALSVAWFAPNIDSILLAQFLHAPLTPPQAEAHPQAPPFVAAPSGTDTGLRAIRLADVSQQKRTAKISDVDASKQQSLPYDGSIKSGWQQLD